MHFQTDLINIQKLQTNFKMCTLSKIRWKFLLDFSRHKSFSLEGVEEHTL